MAKLFAFMIDGDAVVIDAERIKVISNELYTQIEMPSIPGSAHSGFRTLDANEEAIFWGNYQRVVELDVVQQTVLPLRVRTGLATDVWPDEESSGSAESEDSETSRDSTASETSPDSTGSESTGSETSRESVDSEATPDSD